MILTVEQIRNSHLADSTKVNDDNDSLQAKYYARPLSYYIAWVFIGMEVPAIAIVGLALLTDLVGCFLVATGLPVLGAVYLNIGHVLDYVDGTVARATKTVTELGGYLDRTSDEIVEAAIPIAVGTGLFLSGSPYFGLLPLAYLIMGFSQAVTHLLSTISSLHVRIDYKSAPRELASQGWRRWAYRVGVNIKASTTILLLGLAFVPNGLAIFLLATTGLVVCELILGVYTVVRRKCE